MNGGHQKAGSGFSPGSFPLISTSLEPIATDSIRSLLAAANRLILTGLSSISDLPTVTTSLGTRLGEDSAAFCAWPARRASKTKTTVSGFDQRMREQSAELDGSFRAAAAKAPRS